VAKFDISQFPFSPEHKRELASVLANPDHSLFWKRIAVLDCADVILARLVTEANNNPPTKDSKPLSLNCVAEFLATISMSDRSALVSTVKRGLRSLGISSSQRGRPRGRKAEILYFEAVNVLERAIEQTGAFDNKLRIRKHFGAKWRFEFERYLGRQKWPKDYYYLLCASKATPHIIAVKIASEIFPVSEERIRRACRNVKSVKK
jgi:hypothetical protein